VGENTPHEIVDGFGVALRAGDVGAATALFSRHACFVTPDSTVIQGRPQISGFLRQFCDMAGELTFEQRTMVTAGDVAVGSENWTVRFGSNGDSVRRTTRSTIVLNRIEGFWRIAVVDPWRGT
jgi:ketosteroid isomerase-like protein